jgi:hypothetical protein
VGGARHDTAEAHLADEPRVVRIADVVLLEVARAPARDVEEAIVEREVDVGDERRDGLEALEERRQLRRVGGLGGDGDDLLDRPAGSVAVV